MLFLRESGVAIPASLLPSTSGGCAGWGWWLCQLLQSKVNLLKVWAFTSLCSTCCRTIGEAHSGCHVES